MAGCSRSRLCPSEYNCSGGWLEVRTSTKLIEETSTSYIIELKAKSKKLVYQKEELEIDKETFVATKGILSSASGRALRQLENKDIRKIGKYYVAFYTEMKDLIKRQGSTKLIINSIKLDTNINPRLFTKENLSW